MANRAKEHEALLRRHRFALVSENEHLKYKDPEGRVYICAKTPSDWRAWRNAVSTLKRVITNPVPSSEVIEEEQQREELETSIVLKAQRQPSVTVTKKHDAAQNDQARQNPVSPAAVNFTAYGNNGVAVLTNYELTIAKSLAGTLEFFRYEIASRRAIRRAAMQLADALGDGNPCFDREEFLRTVGGPSLPPEIE